MTLSELSIALTASVLAAIAIVVGARLVLYGSLRSKDGLADSRLAAAFAFGTGVFLAMVLLDFLPDAWDLESQWTPWALFAGAVFLWLATALTDRQFDQSQAKAQAMFSRASAIILMIALSLHTFLEGVSLAAVSTHMDAHAWVILIGLVVHKLPEGVLWAIALLAAVPDWVEGQRGRVFAILCVPAAATIAGTLVGWGLTAVLTTQALGIVLAFLAGALLYIGFSELLPGLREFGSHPVYRFAMLGAALMVLLSLIGV